MKTHKKILDSVIIDLRNLAENEQKHISKFVYDFLWNTIQGIEHDIKEIKEEG